MASVNVEARRRLVQHAAKLVRCSIRTWLVREELTTLRVAYEHEQAKERAVIKIQSCWRGSCARQQVTNARTARKKRIMLFRASASLQATSAKPVLVRVRMVNGDVHSCEALPFDTIRRLKAQLATRTGDQLMLRDLHFDEGRQLPELTLVLGPPIPSWAFELGFDGDFPGCLRDYFAKHSEEQLSSGIGDGKPGSFLIRGIVRAAPNQEIELEARGWIQNCTGDNTATHQLLLAVDTWVVGELYSGVPSFKDPFATPIRFTAPKADGVYMLWRSGDLQDTMVDAKRFFELRHTRADPELYPTNFVGWLIALARRHLAKKRVAKMRAAQLRVSHNAATTIRKMWLGFDQRRKYLALRKELRFPLFGKPKNSGTEPIV
eukprot:g2846.t2